jgi:Gram-negative bacterial TonB protein C-terminal
MKYRLAIALAGSLASHWFLLTAGVVPAITESRTSLGETYSGALFASGQRSPHFFTAVIVSSVPGIKSGNDRPSSPPDVRMVLDALGGAIGEGKQPGVPKANLAGEETGPVPSALSMRYFTSRELDSRPEPLQQIDPEFPLTVDPGVRGSVVVRLLLGTDGKVEKVIPIRSEPEGVFVDAVVKAFADARYTPGMIRGKPVKVQMVLEVEFENMSFNKPEGAGSGPKT